MHDTIYASRDRAGSEINLGWGVLHRRVKAADLLAYQQRDEADRKKVLDELTAEAEKHGLGY